MPILNYQLCVKCESKIPLGKMQCSSCRAYQPDISQQDESVLLSDVSSAEGTRIDVGPYNYVWGGGIIATSVTLLGGYPGAGKSTMLLQLLQAVYDATKRKSIYIATEEALPEVRARADRLTIRNKESIRMVPAMSGVGDIGSLLLKHKPSAIILDSLQGMTGDNDALGVELLLMMKKYSVELISPSIVISHVNKDGDYAGLMTYQHAVDTLLKLVPDEDDGIRELSVLKNRNGRAFIESNFEMTEFGLIPVLDDKVEEVEEDDDE